MTNNTKTVVIIEDEKSGRTLLKNYLLDYADYEIIGEADNGLSGIELINELQPDIVFLDIQMPGKTGIQMLPYLNRMPHIVFTTAYDKFAIDAFEIEAIDFLLKPYTKDRFAKAMQKIQTWINNERLTSFIQNQVFAQAPTTRRILVQTGKQSVTINVDDIYYLEAYGDYAKIITKSGTYISNLGISKLEEKLGDGFIKVHRSYTAAIKHVSRLTKEDGIYHLLMANGEPIKVSRNYNDIVLSQFVN